MWLSRLIVTAGLLLLSACSGFEIKSLGQALYEQNAVIAVVETGLSLIHISEPTRP